MDCYFSFTAPHTHTAHTLTHTPSRMFPFGHVVRSGMVLFGGSQLLSSIAFSCLTFNLIGFTLILVRCLLAYCRCACCLLVSPFLSLLSRWVLVVASGDVRVLHCHVAISCCYVS